MEFPITQTSLLNAIPRTNLRLLDVIFPDLNYEKWPSFQHTTIAVAVNQPPYFWRSKKRDILRLQTHAAPSASLSAWHA